MSAAIARREGNTIVTAFGTCTVLYEASNGVVVVKWGSCKHFKEGEPDILVRYELARIFTGDAAETARGELNPYGNHRRDGYPDVWLGLSLGRREGGMVVPEEMYPGRRWKAAREKMVELAENFTG